jgi:hypothetical protein
MRGKIRAATRFSRLKNDMLLKFKDDQSIMTEFVAFFREIDQTQFESSITVACDEEENLFHLQGGPSPAIYQVLRIADRPVLLRELEVLADYVWGIKDGKKRLYTALSVLYGVNLVSYTFRDFNSTPSNVVQFSVKEEE